MITFGCFVNTLAGTSSVYSDASTRSNTSRFASPTAINNMHFARIID